MEDALVLSLQMLDTSKTVRVLILVLMEDALVLSLQMIDTSKETKS